MHFIFYYQNALCLQTVLKLPTQTEIMSTRHSLKRNFCQEKLQKTHCLSVRYIITRMSQLQLMAPTVARMTFWPEKLLLLILKKTILLENQRVIF